jgi:hypothetical protein
MFRVSDVSNVAQKRTIRPLYAATQATPWAGYLDPNWTRTVDIYPGMVMTKLANEVFTLASTSTAKGFGLADLFVAPVLGIDEVKQSGTNNFTVWVGGLDSAFEVLAPAFDTTADWSMPTDGTRKLLTHTLTAHAKGPGLLTPVGTANASANPIAELISVIGTGKIEIRLGVSS